MPQLDKASKLLDDFNALNDYDKDIVLQLLESLKKKHETRSARNAEKAIKTKEDKRRLQRMRTANS